jgi:GNAT superfamily N-acetyltransferase
MALTLVPITKVLQKQAFDCGNKILNDYFRFYALKNDNLNIGKTFVAIESEIVAGFITLSNAQIIAENLPDDIRSGLPKYPVPALRIAKLAVDRNFQKKGIGAWLLRSAFEKALAISEQVGIFSILVDAIDEKAQGFYLKYGFIPFTEYPLTLFLPLSVIREARKNYPEGRTPEYIQKSSEN